MKFRLLYILCLTFIGLSSCQKQIELSESMNDSFYLRNDNVDMPVHCKGNGASKVMILVLHGGPGDGGLIYSNHTFSNNLEKEYALVYWDQRHQGNSHGHLKEEDINIDVMVEDTYLMVKTLKARYGGVSIFLWGHSWGGCLGTAFMLKNDYQNEINGWIESAGAHDFPLMNVEIVKRIQTAAPIQIQLDKNKEEWQEMLDYVNEIDTSNISAEEASDINSYAGQAERLMIDSLNSKSQSQLSDISSIFFTPDNPVTRNTNALQLPFSFFEEIITNSLTDQLYKITSPTLLLWGQYDFKVPLLVGQKAFEQINTTEKYFKIYSKSGHSCMRYEPEKFTNDVVDFIEKYK